MWNSLSSASSVTISNNHPSQQTAANIATPVSLTRSVVRPPSHISPAESITASSSSQQPSTMVNLGNLYPPQQSFPINLQPFPQQLPPVSMADPMNSAAMYAHPNQYPLSHLSNGQLQLPQNTDYGLLRSPYVTPGSNNLGGQAAVYSLNASVALSGHPVGNIINSNPSNFISPAVVVGQSQTSNPLAQTVGNKRTTKKKSRKSAKTKTNPAAMMDAVNGNSMAMMTNLGAAVPKSLCPNIKLESIDPKDYKNMGVNVTGDNQTIKLESKFVTCNADGTPVFNLKPPKIEDPLLKPYQCEQCLKRFGSLKSLKTHRLIHSNIRPHKCSICAKAFVRADKMRAHEITHLNLKPFECATCGRRFTRSDKLKIHHRVHTGVKPYACSFCPKRFTRSDKLRIHERIHTRLKPYPCSVCGKCFSRSDKRKIHEQTHMFGPKLERKPRKSEASTSKSNTNASSSLATTSATSGPLLMPQQAAMFASIQTPNASPYQTSTAMTNTSQSLAAVMAAALGKQLQQHQPMLSPNSNITSSQTGHIPAASANDLKGHPLLDQLRSQQNQHLQPTHQSNGLSQTPVMYHTSDGEQSLTTLQSADTSQSLSAASTSVSQPQQNILMAVTALNQQFQSAPSTQPATSEYLHPSTQAQPVSHPQTVSQSDQSVYPVDCKLEYVPAGLGSSQLATTATIL